MSSDDKKDPSAKRSPQNIDAILNTWPFSTSQLSVRVAAGDDGRDVLQMRLDLGLMQLEVTGRPDGSRPQGFETFLDYLLAEETKRGLQFIFTEEECAETDREFVQFYHRRICWLSAREFGRAAADAEHTLTLMDVAKRHSPDDQWKATHEQYRPFVLFHKTQATALDLLEQSGPEASVEAINEGLNKMKEFFVEHEAEETFDEDEMVVRLRELQTSLRKQFDVGRTLKEQLSDAIASEQYELAAKLRDELDRRGGEGKR